MWKWISCSNDIMNYVDCVIKRDVYPWKMHSCSKNIRGIYTYSEKKETVHEKSGDFFLEDLS